jgi:hypothetical protein
LKQIRKRLTYANVMSSIAVFLVLGGGAAIAAKSILPKNSVGKKQLTTNAVTTAKIKKDAVTTAKIKKNAVTTAKIRNDAVTGDKVNESTLGTVPSAVNAQNAVNAGSFEKYVPFGIVTANNGETKTLVNYGPFSLIGLCKADGVNLGAFVVFATTEDGTSFGGDDNSGGSIGPGTPEADRIIEDAGASSAGAPENSDGYDDQFNAQAPSGASWAGTVESWASKDAGQCRWSGYILKTS